MGRELNTRWKSAAVMLAVIFIVGIINSPVVTWLFLGAVGFFALLEANRLWGLSEDNNLILSAVIWAAAYFFNNPVNLIFITLIVLASKMAYDKSINKKDFLPFIYPVAGMLFIWALYLNWGMKSLVWLLVIVALTDVGAYYAGKKFGKSSFSPTSPNKTIEGVYGGVAIATFFGSVIIANSSSIGAFAAIVIAFLTSLASVFGDLFESYLKREAGVKDSGDLIPGHGGVLDRIDGYLFASVALFILLETGK